MTDFDARLAELRARFAVRAGEDKARLQAALDSLDRSELKRLAHGLSGSAGIFGFSQISRDSQALEEAVDTHASGEDLLRLAAILLQSLDEAARDA